MDELQPVPFFTVSTQNATVTSGAFLDEPPNIRVANRIVPIIPPKNLGMFSTCIYHGIREGVFCGKALEIILGHGKNSTHPFTKTFYNFFDLPSYVRLAAFVKVQAQAETLIAARPVSPLRRVQLWQKIKEYKENKKNSIPSLLREYKSIPVGTEQDLFPFVIPVYPVAGKIMRYRIFAVLIGKTGDTWNKKTAFEVITSRAENIIIETRCQFTPDMATSVKVINRLE